MPVLKTSAVLEKGQAGRLPEGGVTIQLQAQNDRHMMSDIVSESVVVGDSKPTLTGEIKCPAWTDSLKTDSLPTDSLPLRTPLYIFQSNLEISHP